MKMEENDKLVNNLNKKNNLKSKLTNKIGLIIFGILIVIAIINLKIYKDNNYNITTDLNIHDNRTKIKIKFENFWKNFSPDELSVYNIMRTKYNVIIDNKNPDYIFYSVFGKKKNYFKYPDKIKILFIFENVIPKFEYADYIFSPLNITFSDRHFTMNYIHRYMNQKFKHFPIVRQNIPKNKFCAFIVSNCQCIFRNEFFTKLSQYKKVDSGGECFNNIGKKVQNKTKFLQNYKFAITMENSQSPGYLTEKIIDGFLAGLIPIYWGDPDITKIFNPKAFINIRNESDIPAAIELIIKIDNDDELYNSYMNEHIFNNDNYFEDEYKKLENFISHIFEQNYNNTKRINQYRYHYNDY